MSFFIYIDLKSKAVSQEDQERLSILFSQAKPYFSHKDVLIIQRNGIREILELSHHIDVIEEGGEKKYYVRDQKDDAPDSLLGSGGFGKVKRSRFYFTAAGDRQEHDKVAKIQKCGGSKQQLRETRVQVERDHTALDYETSAVLTTQSHAGATKKIFYMPRVPGITLYGLLEQKLSFGERVIIYLECLQEYKRCFPDKGRYHRDLTLVNFIYDPQEKKVRIIDYGSAVNVGEAIVEPGLGTASFVAPEIHPLYRRVGYEQRIGPATEMFALGKTGAILFGLHPNEYQNVAFPEKEREERLGTLDSRVQGFFQHALDPRHRQRPTIEQAIDHFTVLLQQEFVKLADTAMIIADKLKTTDLDQKGKHLNQVAELLVNVATDIRKTPKVTVEHYQQQYTRISNIVRDRTTLESLSHHSREWLAKIVNTITRPLAYLSKNSDHREFGFFKPKRLNMLLDATQEFSNFLKKT